MYTLYIALLIASGATVILAAPNAVSTPGPQPTAAPQPAYQPQDPGTGYIPHATYTYADTYGPAPGYEGYLIPAVGAQYVPPQGDYGAAVAPKAQGALQVTLRVLAKIGLFLIGGLALLIVGGVFTTAVCSLTPLCTINFNGFGGINKDVMRAYVTPERVASAAAFVEDAVTKYQRLQRAVN